jgi:acetolactate synthase-1/2/3 large subunit
MFVGVYKIKMIKVSDYIAKRLKEVYNVKHIFMVSGGGAMHLNDSLGKYIPYIANHHEQACSIAAEGYARVNQELAVVNITTGPGGLNCLNGVFGQWTDSVPVLYISGQVKYSTTIHSCPEIPLRQLGDQEVDIISVVKPLTKYAHIVIDPYEIKYHLDKAIHEATSGRFGPVWLDIPMNVQTTIIDETKLKKYNYEDNKLSFSNIISEIEQVKELLEKAKRPIVIAGHGITISRSKKAFLQLLEKLKIPVVTTMNGFDIVAENNEYFIGRIGTVANRAGNFALQNADLVLSIGSRNNIRQISYNWENFAKNAKLITIDIDKAELDKPTLNPIIKINADCKDFIEKFYSKLDIVPNYNEWVNWCKNIKIKYPTLTEADRVGHNPIEPYYFIRELTKCFSDDEIIVGGNGTAFLVPFQVGIVKENQRYIWNSGNASMGYDLPAAIGACLANNNNGVICLAGDGSIMMNLQELQTIKHYNLPIKIFVLNNNGYISIQQTQKNFFPGNMVACSTNSGVSIPDFIKVGNSFGLKTVKIEKLKNLDKQIKDVLNYDGPVLCEVMLSSDYIFAPKLSARTLEDGTMISPSLEDMFPFLDREEYEENMLV